MSQSKVEKQRPQEVIEEYLSSAPDPGDIKYLKEWLIKYPQYRLQLIESASEWRSRQGTSSGLDRVVTNGDLATSSFEEILRYEREELLAEEARVPITSLREEAMKASCSMEDLAELLKLSVPILDLLDHHLIIPSTIPRVLIEDLTLELPRIVESVEAYLNQAAAPGPSDDRTVSPVSFLDALRADKEISEEHRRHWLSLSEKSCNSSLA